MHKIKNIIAREILDSRGNPTVETKVELDSGEFAVASVPSGASTGVHEAHELRDGDKHRYNGKGVEKACANVNGKIKDALIGMSAEEQQNIDKTMIELDGTADKENLGANAILSVSLATARVASAINNMPLYKYIRQIYGIRLPAWQTPIPFFNIINGGQHADSNLDFQEFMVIPLLNTSFKERLRIGSEIFHQLGHVLKADGLDIDVGNEGGYAPNMDSAVKAVEYIMQAIEKAGYKPGKEVAIGMDAGASTFYLKEKKLYSFALDGSFLDSDQLIYLYKEWFEKYPFLMVEDPLAEDDWSSWVKMTREFGEMDLKIHNYKTDNRKIVPVRDKKIHPVIVGDDLFTTNVNRLREGVRMGAANSVVVKLNQIGTLSETIDFARLAQDNDYSLLVSHRSGETHDDFIADLSVALGSEFIKAGAPSRGERVAKYNRLLKIEEEISV